MTPLDAVLDPPASPSASLRAAQDRTLRVLIVDDHRGDDSFRDALTRHGVAVIGHTSMKLHDVEGLLVRQAMTAHQGNVSRAARTLGLSRSALYRRLERHQITAVR